MTMTPTFPDDFNLADYFLFDRVREGRGDKVALRFGDRSVDVRRGRRALARARAVPRRRRAASRAARLHRAARHAGVRVEHLRRRSPPAACSRWATRSRRPRTSRTSSTTCKARRADHDARGRGARSRRGSRRCRTCTTCCSSPDAATGDGSGGAGRGPAEVAARSAIRRSSLDAAIARGASSTTRAADDPARRSGDLAVHVGLDRPAEGRDAHATATSRSTPRSTRSARSAIARTTSRSACRACSSATRPARTCGSRSRSARRSACSASGRPPRVVAAAIARYRRRSSRTCRRCSASSSISTTSGARAASPASICRACGSTSRPARRCPSRCCAGSSSGSAARSTTASARAEMFHIYCSNRPGDVKPGSLGRVVDGYELADPARGRRRRRARRRCRPARSACCGSRATRVAHGYFQRSRQELEDVPRPLVPHRRSVRDRRATATCTSQGRADDLFKVGGIFVAPREVEDCLLAHPAVSVVAVIPAEDAGPDQAEGARRAAPRRARRLATADGRPSPTSSRRTSRRKLSQAQVSALGRVRRRSAEERSRQGRQEALDRAREAWRATE